MKKINFIDIFSGAGGLSYSFKNRKHNLKLAIDIDKTSILTLKKNYPLLQRKFIKEDIKKVVTNNLIFKFNN